MSVSPGTVSNALNGEWDMTTGKKANRRPIKYGNPVAVVQHDKLGRPYHYNTIFLANVFINDGYMYTLYTYILAPKNTTFVKATPSQYTLYTNVQY